jgi:hypothetical protein
VRDEHGDVGGAVGELGVDVRDPARRQWRSRIIASAK